MIETEVAVLLTAVITFILGFIIGRAVEHKAKKK